ncbi:hypothetical protein RFI_25525 [Reticulomyxa filosa]|uniref:Uncharacterized protein n=1 Tax=Reticulomyxa filosa TaxID=46433 RepID=X6MEL1_RETFI|nr:hypothetical protein RFI_25525 [Reticulomyxa filosa]|eukprot:ETO11852.1 hypothetical protein RFI_25525 [Reticulomyxa filosa]
MNVTWEDNARNKDSASGYVFFLKKKRRRKKFPCISDMTLQVNKELMPVIREPNYSDKTWDMSMDKMVIVVGNEKKDQSLKSIPLKEYLESFDQYMSKPPANTKLNLLRKGDNKEDKDTHVIMSSQACFLPVEASAETKFNVALYNYQSRSENPAILVIVSTSKGSSAQIIEGFFTI